MIRRIVLVTAAIALAGGCSKKANDEAAPAATDPKAAPEAPADKPATTPKTNEIPSGELNAPPAADEDDAGPGAVPADEGEGDDDAEGETDGDEEGEE